MPVALASNPVAGLLRLLVDVRIGLLLASTIVPLPTLTSDTLLVSKIDHLLNLTTIAEHPRLASMTVGVVLGTASDVAKPLISITSFMNVIILTPV